MLFTYLCLLINLSTAQAAEDLFLSWFQESNKEIIDEPVSVKVQGRIPAYVNGKLFRTGPAIITTPKKNYTNFIDAFGRVTAWTIDGATNSARFQSSVLRTNLYNHSYQNSDIAPHMTQQKTEPATLPGVLDLNDMDNTDVIMYRFPDTKDRLLMFTDFYVLNEVHIPSLRSLGSVVHPESDEAPDGIMFSCSHATEYIEPDGKVVLVNWIGKKTATGSELYIFKMGSDMVRRMIGSVKLGFIPYSIHSIAVAGDYAALTVGPVELEFMKSGATMCLSCATKDNLSAGTTQLFLFSLKAADYSRKGVSTPPIATYDFKAPDAFFTFHYLNAFSYTPQDNVQETVVVLDMCSYLKMDGVVGDHVLGDLKDVYNVQTRNSMPALCDVVNRVEVSVKGKKVLTNVKLPLIDSKGNTIRPELLTVNTKFTGPDRKQKNCFGYALAYHANGSERYEDVGLLKIDTCKAMDLATNPNSQVKYTTTVWHQDNIYTGEPVFVPNPAGTAEDDGTLLVVSK